MQPLAHGASSSVEKESRKDTEATWKHYLQIPPDTSHCLEAVFSMVRKINGKQPVDPMEDLNVKLAIWRMFMNTTLRAVHLGKDYDMNLRFVKSYLWKATGQLFRETEKLISEQTETTGINLINFRDLRWMSTSLFHSRAYQYSTAKVCVFSRSALCLGKMGDDPVESWKRQIREYNRIDGHPMEFEWKIFPEIHNSGNPQSYSTNDGRITV